MILVVYISLASLFVLHGRRELKDNLTNKASQIASLFTYSARPGLLAESEDMLKDPLEGIMREKSVILVQAFTKDGQMLIENALNGVPPHAGEGGRKAPEKILDTLRETASPYYSETRNEIDLWSPVFSTGEPADEDLRFGELRSDTRNHISGFTRIVITKTVMNEQINTLILSSVVMPVLFMLAMWGLIFFKVRGISRSLNNLAEGLISAGKGGPVKMLKIESNDDTGRLAGAFNNMIISLRTKDEEKKQEEEQLRHSEKMESIGTLAAGIAHDFNNVMSVISGYANLMQRTADLDDNSKKYMESLLSTAERASFLIKGLLAFSTRQPIELRTININSTIAKIKNNIQRLLGESIQLAVIHAEDDTTVLSDTGQIEQILINLALNAKDAMPDGGTLTISTEQATIENKFPIASGCVLPGRYVLISVADTGTGMDSRTFERMFDPFFTTKRPGKGTGLGLSMVYGMIKKHNGYIDVISKPGRGTTFRIYLHAGKTVHEKKEDTA